MKDYVRLARTRSREVFIPLAHPPGHAQVPLAYLSPRIVEAIANGTAPADLTVTSLARALPHGWAEQEQKLGNQLSSLYQPTPAANIHSKQRCPFAQRDRSRLLAWQLMETVCRNCEPVSRQVKSGLGFAARESPGDPKMRRRDRPPKCRQKAPQREFGTEEDRMPPRNPRKCRTFPRDPRRSRKNQHAWLGDLKFEPRLRRSRSSLPRAHNSQPAGAMAGCEPQRKGRSSSELNFVSPLG